MIAEPVIRVSNLSIGWDDVVLQKNASFDVARGDVFAILGVSGCGKSTLMRYLVGLETPMHGTVVVATASGHEKSHTSPDGAPPADPSGRAPMRHLHATSESQHLEVGRPPFGVVFQSGALFTSMTVGENVGLPLHTWTDLEPEAVGAIVSAKLSLVGLRGVEDKLPSELSGGMTKRAAIARAMALEPSLLFLDEPSAGLDPVTAVELDELILVLNRALGLTVVVVTHELASIFKIVSRCIMLDRESQSIIAAGSPADLRDSCSDPRVQRFFQRTAKVH